MMTPYLYPHLPSVPSHRRLEMSLARWRGCEGAARLPQTTRLKRGPPDSALSQVELSNGPNMNGVAYESRSIFGAAVQLVGPDSSILSRSTRRGSGNDSEPQRRPAAKAVGCADVTLISGLRWSPLRSQRVGLYLDSLVLVLPRAQS
jgi:hypothetical protein